LDGAELGKGHDGDVSTEDCYEQWASDARVLAEIGAALSSQSLSLPVRIPRAIADKAVSAWERDDSGAALPEETPAQVLARKRAAALALIGLAVKQGGTVNGDEVVVEVDAWNVGTALDAAEDANAG
jgi:hypothetical protein